MAVHAPKKPRKGFCFICGKSTKLPIHAKCSEQAHALHADSIKRAEQQRTHATRRYRNARMLDYWTKFA